jgi:hypothetical protein
LQVEDVALGEAFGRARGRVDRQAPLLVQVEVAGIGPDHLVRVDHEEIVQEERHVLFHEAVGRQPRNAQMTVLRATFGVGGQLH